MLPAANTKYLSVNFAAVAFPAEEAPKIKRSGFKSIDTPLSSFPILPEYKAIL
jgi:hypothetical protein